MKRGRKRHLFYVALVLILLILTGVFTLTLRRKRSSEAVVTELDRLISSGSWEDAAEWIDTSLLRINTELELVKTLKRAFLITQKTGDTVWLERVSREIYAKESGNPIVVYLTARAMMQNEHWRLAYEMLDKHRHTENLISLKTEAALYLKDESLLPWSHPEMFGLLELIHSRDPLDFMSMAQKLGDSRLLVNAALLYLEGGNRDEALRVVPKDASTAELRGLIAFDVGDDTQALQTIGGYLETHEKRMDLHLLFADILMLSGRFRDAEIYYHALVQGAEDRIAATASLNLAWMLYREGRSIDALTVLREARHEHPEDRRIAISLSKLMNSLGDQDEAILILQEYLRSAGEDREVRIHLAVMLMSPLSSRYHQNELWLLFNRDPTNGRLCRYLFWYLIGQRDNLGAAMVLKRYGAAGGETGAAWYLHFLGLIAAIEGDLDRAEDHLEESIRSQETSEALFNRGIILMKRGGFDEAEAALWWAFEAEKRGEGRLSAQSIIRAKLGELFLQRQKYGAAQRELRYALELDPANGRARVLLKELEKKRQN